MIAAFVQVLLMMVPAAALANGAAIGLSTPVSELGLSARALNVLERLQVRVVADAAIITRQQLYLTPKVGSKVFNEIQSKFDEIGFPIPEDDVDLLLRACDLALR